MVINGQLRILVALPLGLKHPTRILYDTVGWSHNLNSV